MQREVFYIIQCTSEENQAGTHHYSKPFTNGGLAKSVARRIKNDFVMLEKHQEIFEHNDWRPNWDNPNWNQDINL